MRLQRPDPSPRRLALAVGSGLLGTVGTAGLTVGYLTAASPVGTWLYGLVYLRVGPSTATTAAVVITMTLGSVLAIASTTLVVAALRGARDRLPRLAALLGGAVVCIALSLIVATILGVISLLAALVVVVGLVVVVPVGARLLGTWPAGMAAFAGGIPILFLAVALLGFGLGWGGGYDVVAQEVPADGVDPATAVDLDDAPAVEAAIFSDGYCELEDGLETCRLSLRGYDDEAMIARFLARHGVRCPYRNADPTRPAPPHRTFVAEHDGAYYEISCVAYGD